MNLIKTIFTIVCLTAMITTNSFGQTKIMSYNIRYDTPNDGDNWWEFRKEEVVDLLSYYQPDFFGIQEAMPRQLNFIADELTSYAYIGHGRDGENTISEATPIFYDKNTYELIAKEVFWLSKNPKKPSKGWDAALNRIVVYGSFKHKKTKQTIHVINTHFDHLGEKARLKSAELLLSFIKEQGLKKEQLIVMGDFNCLPTDEPIRILKEVLNDPFDSKKSYGPIGTYNAFDTEKTVTRRIDYVFTKNISVKKYRCIDDRRKNNKYPSDHFPILIEF